MSCGTITDVDEAIGNSLPTGAVSLGLGCYKTWTDKRRVVARRAHDEI